MGSRKLFKLSPLVVFLFLESFALLVVSYQVQVDDRLTLLEKTGLIVISPFQSIANKSADYLFTVFQKRRAFSDLVRRNELLNKQVAKLDLLEYSLNQARRDNQRLRKLLDMKALPNWDLIICDVIGKTKRYGGSIFIINKGSRDGLTADIGVICNDGVVGIVWEVGPYSSKVITLRSPGAIVAAMTEDSQYMDAYSSGKGSTTGRLENVPNFESVQVGAKILTSGMDSLFPKGLPIGVVSAQKKTNQMFQHISIRYKVDLSRVQEVIVLKASLSKEVDK